MSNWINEKAEEYRTKKELEEKKANLMLESAYWTEVISQITTDIAEINNHPVWKEVLLSVPIEMIQKDNGYEITKQRFPEVTIFIKHDFDKKITVNTLTKENRDSKSKPNNEILTLNSDGTKVYLVTQNGEDLCIPKETAKYVLMPIINAMMNRL